MTTLAIPNRYLTLAPVIVTSPTPRCGTTLVQRLLSASSNAFLYGEEVGLQMSGLTATFVHHMKQFDEAGAESDSDFQRALAGTLDDWRPGLMPPCNIMLRAWTETYYQLPATLAEYGASIRRPIWGFKGPAYTRDMLKAFLMLMPLAKVIYLFRNPFDTLKSAKARRFVTSDEQAMEFCSTWATNMREVSHLSSDQRVMFLRYEALVEKPADHIQLLQLFTGAQNLDQREMGLKINTFQGDESLGFSPSKYIQPVDLTAADRAAIFVQAEPIIDRLYPQLAERYRSDPQRPTQVA